MTTYFEPTTDLASHEGAGRSTEGRAGPHRGRSGSRVRWTAPSRGGTAHGIIVRANGVRHPLADPVTTVDLEMILGPAVGAVRGRHPAHPDIPLVMHVDREAHVHGMQPNELASALSTIRWSVIGDVIVTAASGGPLMPPLVQDVLTPRTLVPQPT